MIERERKKVYKRRHVFKCLRALHKAGILDKFRADAPDQKGRSLVFHGDGTESWSMALPAPSGAGEMKNYTFDMNMKRLAVKDVPTPARLD